MKGSEITATYRIVTPMFIGGANPNAGAELRPPSIKAALRFWYRAVDAGYKDHEARLFGGTGRGEGQALFLLTVSPMLTGNRSWNRNRYGGLNEEISRPNLPEHVSADTGTWTLNGITYLGFSLAMGDNNRKAIEPGQEFTVRLWLRNEMDAMDQRRLAAALWLLGHLGGLGSRSRRGFGTTALRSWNWPEGCGEHDTLPIAHTAESPEQWRKRFQDGLSTLRAWFPQARTPDHTVLEGARFYLFEEGGKEVNNYSPWEMALDSAGKAMQRFRQRWNLDDPDSDYFRVKRHLMKKDRNTPPQHGLTAAQLTGRAPARSAFGLPLTFRYSTLAYQKTDKHGNPKTRKDRKPDMLTPSVTFQGESHDRSGSPVWIRVVEIGGRCHPFFAILNAPLLPDGESVVGAKNMCRPVSQPGRDILDEFSRQELAPRSLEVVQW